MAHARPSTLEDARLLAPRLRVEDVQEVETTGMSPLAALTIGVCGTECLTIMDREDPVGMFGINHVPSLGPDQANVWLLATPSLVRIQREFMRETLPWLLKFHQRFPLLWNLVDSRNTTHVRWLRFFGFNFLKAVPINGVDFLEFARIG